jgi:hypothetical protein
MHDAGLDFHLPEFATFVAPERILYRVLTSRVGFTVPSAPADESEETEQGRIRYAVDRLPKNGLQMNDLVPRETEPAETVVAGVQILKPVIIRTIEEPEIHPRLHHRGWRSMRIGNRFFRRPRALELLKFLCVDSRVVMHEARMAAETGRGGLAEIVLN